MSIRLSVGLGLLLLVSSPAFGQDEQSATASGNSKFWTSPRVELLGKPAAESKVSAANARPSQPLAIQNDTLIVNRKEDGRLTILDRASKRVFWSGDFNIKGGDAKVTTIRDTTFGTGRAIEVVHPDGNRDAVILFAKLPFAVFRSTLHNGLPEATVTRYVRPVQGEVDLGQPADKLKTFGTGGLFAPDKNPGSYVWLAVVEPQSRTGVVFGWLTENRGSGVLFTRAEGNAVQVGGQIDYGRLRLAPDQTETLESLAIGYFDDARLGLELWADAVAKVYRVQLKPQPTGYCTWYSEPHGGAADETSIFKLSQFAAQNLKPFGFSVVQIDDRWQDGYKRPAPRSSPKKNFTTHDPDGPYPSGMKAAADKIKTLGLVPGIWFMPFAGTATDPIFTNRLDLFVKDSKGKPYDTSWGGTSLDMTYEPARAHLRDVANRICNEWGYDYIKIDGLWTGTATAQLYVNSGYREDDIGDAVFHDPNKTNIDAYRDGLKLLRQTIGPDVFILGCNGPQNMRSYAGAFGLLDGMRVGPDNKSTWGPLTRGPEFGSRHYFLHGRVWWNDPDPVYVRASMPLKHAQLICSWAALSGQLNLSSEWLPGLPLDRLDILKRTMPEHGLKTRPADLFEQRIARLWLLTDTSHATRRDVVGAFNWDNDDARIDYPLAQLGLDPAVEYVAFDFWKNELAPVIKGSLQLTLPGQSCAVIAVRPATDHPQLLSTSRHVTQGIIDVLDENWNSNSNTLSGRSNLVGDDAYELRIVVPKSWEGKSWQLTHNTLGSPRNGTVPADGLVRAMILSPESREVKWSVKFK